MHAGSLQIRWLTFSGENWAVSYPYSLGNIIQFHKLLSDPMDLNLTRHEKRLLLVHCQRNQLYIYDDTELQCNLTGQQWVTC